MPSQEIWARGWAPRLGAHFRVDAAPKKYRFQAAIQAGIGGGAAVIFPFDVEKEFGVKGRVPVKATFNDVPCMGSLMKCGDSSHMLGILKGIREQIGKGPGDVIDVVVWKDEAERALEIPAEFAQRMKEEKLFAGFEKLSFTHRREYIRWISEAKKEETRLNRIQEAIAMLREGARTPG